MSKKKHSPLDFAHWFLNCVDRESGDDITHLKLQKLLYYAQAWHLANQNRELFAEDMEAWTHGPVVPSVWQAYKDCGWSSLPPVNREIDLSKSEENLLELVYKEYGKFSAKELERLTHSEHPWKKTRGDLPIEAKCSNPIDKKMMRDYYAARIGKAWQ